MSAQLTLDSLTTGRCSCGYNATLFPSGKCLCCETKRVRDHAREVDTPEAWDELVMLQDFVRENVT